jgi:muramoyltetrapeptide carboxypeptidase
MKRRNFTKLIGTGLLGLTAVTPSMGAKEVGEICRRRTLIKPVRLLNGATVSLIAPSSPISEEKYLKAINNLKGLGFQVKPGKYVKAREGYLAGTDEQRLADLHDAFLDDTTQAVWCVRGGYGSARLLSGINYDLIRKHSKPFIGYSDVTAMHLAIHQNAGLVTYHGPVAASDFTDTTTHHFKRMLMYPTSGYAIMIPLAKELVRGDEYQAFVISPGKATGALIGGNLSLLAALVGTSFEADYRGKIVFIEEVGEKPYRIDRLLTQLLQATNLKDAAGIALGVFSDCAPKPDESSWSLRETLMDRLGGLNIPVQYGFPFGHIADQATIPYGLTASLNTDLGSLTFEDSGVV